MTAKTIANLKSQVAADFATGVKGGSTAAKVRSIIENVADSALMGYVTPQQFGAVGDGVTDDWPAFALMFALVGANGKGTFYPKGPKCFIPAGQYKLTTAPLTGIQLKAQTIIEGDACGMASGFPGTELVFPEDAIGFVINRYNTLLQDIEEVPTGGSDCTIIRNLILKGDLGDDPLAHGIYMRARAHIENVVVLNFTGNGININASAVSSDPLNHGNANCFYLNTVCVQGCGGHGVFCQGGDSNAGVGIHIDVRSNGRWGIYDSSFLGNTWIGCHSQGNGTAGVGVNGATKSSFVHLDGVRYGALGTEAQLVATQPGTDATVWVSMGAGGVHAVCPTWLPDQPEGTYFQGGAYKSDGATAAVMWIGCYVEGGQTGCWFSGLTMALGGAIYGAGFVKGGYIRGDAGNVMTVQGAGAGYIAKAGGVEVTMGGIVDSILQFVHDNDSDSNIWRLHRSGNDFQLDNQNSSARIAYKITGENTTETSNRSTTVPYHMLFPRLGLGSGTAMRLHHSLAAVPTSGVWGRGEVIYNSLPSPGGFMGWVCTTGGTAGDDAVFKEWGPIEP